VRIVRLPLRQVNSKTIEQPAHKVFKVGEEIIHTGTGSMGIGQRLHDILSKSKDAILKNSPVNAGRQISKLLVDDFAQTQAPKGCYGAMIGYGANGFHLIELALTDLQPEYKTETSWFCSMGSGQPIADPFLAFISRVLFQTEAANAPRRGIYGLLGIESGD
jgi:hypothetical protein